MTSVITEVGAVIGVWTVGGNLAAAVVCPRRRKRLFMYKPIKVVPPYIPH